MAYTNIKNDPIRIYKDLQQSTDVGRHVLNVPGNGLDVPFINDPQVRMQRWGANHMTDIIGVENSLMVGLTCIPPDAIIEIKLLNIIGVTAKYPCPNDRLSVSARYHLVFRFFSFHSGVGIKL